MYLSERLMPWTLGLVACLGMTACFDPSGGSLASDTEAATGDTAADTTVGEEGPACTPGESQSCACAGGGAGAQVCLPSGTFDACDCGSVDDTTGPDPTDGGSTDEDPTEGEDSTGVPECTGDGDCDAILAPGECEAAVCNGGTCELASLAVGRPCTGLAPDECEVAVCDGDGACSLAFADLGTPCGDATVTSCSTADSCDAGGACRPNDVVEGGACDDCTDPPCACALGSCGQCQDFAPTNTFETARAIEGWTLTGDWGLYRAAPQSRFFPETAFDGQAFGTDGNRSMPYPGAEIEVSTARSTSFIIPPTLNFASWHVDEAVPFDSKAIYLSVDDGGSFTMIADCQVDTSPVFCAFRNDPRAGDEWDLVSLPVPVGLQGMLGIVEFRYFNSDALTGFERGWFVDDLNFATECACAGDEFCTDFGGECGDALCGAAGQCELDPMALGTACGSATDVQCNAADACDGVGYCGEGVAATGLAPCGDCPAGPGLCNLCQTGACVNCTAISGSQDFGGVTALVGWVVEDLGTDGADWRIYFSAPPNTNAGSTPTSLTGAPVFGTDGNRVAPYDNTVAPFNSEVEFSRVTTPPDVVPATITFGSWHQDEGGPTFDTKLIELSTDGGMTWTPLVSCAAGSTQPFCLAFTAERAGTNFDAISIPSGAAGMVGQLRFTYNTVDAGGGGFERGWYIDNLNFAQYCLDPQFP